MKAGKSSKTCLANHTQSISHHITPLAINVLRGGHMGTQRDTDTQTKAFQETRHMGPCGHTSLILKFSASKRYFVI